MIVEEVFDEGRRGLTLMPRITVSESPPPTFRVRLHRPAGDDREATASMQVAHIRGPQGAYAIVRLHDVSAADVPVGTEVWRLD